ncbi:hypothetical protein LCGC14_2124890 [marine sediment metagenome]|uniref:Uncharacterized protein n=1 Tax=marine sediment metagenome TaxID=412755 RepID=A0A0F9GZF2_9ZZZZ
MTIIDSIKSMTNEVINNSNMGTLQAFSIEFVSDLAVRVINTDAINFEYSVTDGSETFRTRNQSVFCNVLEWALS